MKTNTNSFAENLATLSQNASDIVAYAAALNETMAGTESEIKVNDDITLPSYTNIIKRLDRAENTVSSFVQGKGIIEADDGTFRKIKVSTISKPPIDIVGLNDVSTFTINANWFFESLQYPRCVVKVDLTGKIDDDSDRVYVNRVIIDTSSTSDAGDNGLTFYRNNIVGQSSLGYSSLITLLEKAGMAYKEDRSEVALPLTYEKYSGSFTITDVKLVKDATDKSQQWYYLDTINYNAVDENGIVVSTGYLLQVGDMLRFNDSLYKVSDIVASQKRVKLDYAIGYESLGIGDMMDIYNEPFSEKIIEVGIGINEINVVYVKGVNEDYNLLSRGWSTPISFYTNELVFDEATHKTFEDYYKESVADFGYQWILQAKEKQICSLQGLTPNTPTIRESDLNVVQINTQLDATLDKESYNKLTSEIASTKSSISAVRTTLANNKDKLIQSSNSDDRANIQNIINNDTDSLNSLTTQYNSLVNELNTLLNEAGAINYSPKYHIRGFFGIPEPRYTDEINKSGEQVIIGFEIMYRYLHMDETGIKLDSYEYIDSNSAIQTGIFTDWNILQSSILSKTINSETGLYEWTSENTSDGSAININQVDIPIQAGEKVEIKVRSISEAGYPYNPLKSEWSESVIISFPDNLTSDDNVSTMLDTVKSDVNAVILQETLSAAGVYTHTADSNSIYKHTSKNISYTNKKEGTNVVEMSVQDKIDLLDSSLGSLLQSYSDNVDKVDKSIKLLDSSISTLSSSLLNNDSFTATLNSITSTISLLAQNDNTVVKSLNDLFRELYEIKQVLGYSDTSLGLSDQQLNTITTSDKSEIKMDSINAIVTSTRPSYLGAYSNLCTGLDTISAYITQIAESFGLTLSSK